MALDISFRVLLPYAMMTTSFSPEDFSFRVTLTAEGSATLTLGGKLDAPREAELGEWRSPRIIDGKSVDINKGDLIIVPRGTPHQRSTAGKDFTMILIKIYAEPLKPKPAKPAADTKERKP